ncbi:MAG TPA: hypothetical protein VGZ23_04120 [bacterium]|nr:hypothetical protein [bacterium]
MLDRLERGMPFGVLDVRNRDDGERFGLAGRGVVVAINVPYFEMLEMGGKENMVDSVVAYVEQHLAEWLPRDVPILSVCATGDTSEVRPSRLRRARPTISIPTTPSTRSICFRLRSHMSRSATARSSPWEAARSRPCISPAIRSASLPSGSATGTCSR